MNRAKFTYEMVITSCTVVGGVVGSSTFAYESRSNGPLTMAGSAVFGSAIGILGGAIVGATSPITIPGLMIGTAWSLSEQGGKKLIAQSNSILAGTNGPATGKAPPSGSTAPSATT